MMAAAIEDFRPHQEDNAFVVVYFDLETTGFDSSEILQIAAMYGDCTFSVYIKPQFGIPLFASAVNGLTEYEGNLLLNNIPVSSVPLQTGLMQFHSFLNSAGKKCILTAHNCRFDQSHLINAIETVDMMEEFRHLIYGFGDTLPLIKSITRTNKKGANTLSGLAEYLELPYSGAHNAIHDVAILIQILRKLNISDEDVIAKCQSLGVIIALKRQKEYIASLLPDLEPIRDVVTLPIRKKIVCANITYEMMRKTYEEDKEHGLAKLLTEVTKTKRILLALATHFELHGNF